MVSTSKILTVSYGTFSCTLEGFDDSFDTMKAIAEYFRDLAADDRYFGAEPPTPDAEMLARIAEKEISRRVEAHQEEGKIVLRANEVTPLLSDVERPAETAELPAKEEAETSETGNEGIKADAVEAPIADTAAEAVTELTEDDEDEELAAPEMAEDDAVEALETPEVAQADDAEAPEVAEDQAEPEKDHEEALAEDVAEPVAFADQVEEEHTAEAISDETSGPAEDDAALAPDPDSIAAKLRRIRSVVSHAQQPFETDEYNEDEHAQDFLDDSVPDLSAALTEDDTTDAELVEVELDITSLAVAFAAEEETSAEDDSAPDQAKDGDAEQMTDDEDEDDDEVELAHDTLAQLLADAMPESQEDEDTATETDATEDNSPLVLGNADSDADADADADAHPQISARVVKLKRDDLEDAIASGQLEDAGEDSLNMFDSRALGLNEDETGLGSTLSPEDEAELQRELAEVEAELEDLDDQPVSATELFGDDEDDAEEAGSAPQTSDTAEAEEDEAEGDSGENAEMPEEHEETPSQSRGLRKLRQADDGDLTRIFDEADNQRDQPESSQRRSAIQHLRAAVAATRAEKNGKESLQPDVDDTAYRSDLASVVRPRRPRSNDAGTRSARPEEPRPAPLKLVAEQRIDMPQEPIRPRRVSAADVTTVTDTSANDSSFVEFAAKMGATQLPDLLEAAAAYMSDVEGRPQFSRPMLMGKLKEVEKDKFSREDGLRSFGQLLRKGKLQKIKGGRFTVTEETDYRAEARHAG